MKQILSQLILCICLISIFGGQNYVQAQCSNKHAYSVRYSSHPERNNDLVELAASNHQFSTLVAALKAADLVETLRGKGPFTVFAPTNAAFAALPPGTVDDLLKPENKKKLIQILSYHVVPGRIEANDLRNGKIQTVEGGNIAVAIGTGTVQLNNALVTKANQRTVNGVIHTIDRVLIPGDI